MRRQGPIGRLLLGGVLLLLVAAATVAAALMALLGADLSCGVGSGTALAAGPAPTKTALREIPKHYLTIYREAGSAIDISWPFLASIGYQECGHGTGACFVVNPSGCAGPMEIAYVRGSACSPDPSVPTIWERFKTDGDGDDKTSIFDPADAVFTAAKILRRTDGAPTAGGTFAEYRQAACNYYGACADSAAEYADEVMARAVEYGFGGKAEVDARPPSNGRGGIDAGHGHRPPPPPPASAGSTCQAAVGTSASGSEIVHIARSQIGTPEQPLGSNCQRYGPCEEWCSLFVAWVWERAGVPLRGGTAPYAYSASIYEWARDHSGTGLPATAPGDPPLSQAKANGARVLPPDATPAPGDAILFGYGLRAMEHIGIVERVFPNGEITTIDGNFADRVERVGPFLPSEALKSGEPAPVYGYAVPPTGGPEGARP